MCQLRAAALQKCPENGRVVLNRVRRAAKSSRLCPLATATAGVASGLRGRRKELGVKAKEYALFVAEVMRTTFAVLASLYVSLILLFWLFAAFLLPLMVIAYLLLSVFYAAK